MIIAETSVETGPSEIEAARSLITGGETAPNVLGFIWFDFDKDGVDWQLESRPTVRAAMATDVARLAVINPKK